MVDAVNCKSWHVVWPTSLSGYKKKSPSPVSKDDITLRQVTVAPPSGSQIRVKVHSSGITPLNIFNLNKLQIKSEKRKKSRLFGLWGRSSAECKPTETFSDGYYGSSMEGVGVVDATGADVTDLYQGDLVVFYGALCKTESLSFWSEYVLVERESVVKVDSVVADVNDVDDTGAKDTCKRLRIPDRDLASMPYHCWTAYIALFDKLLVKSHESIYIECGHSLSGVAYVAAQLALYYGLEVMVGFHLSSDDCSSRFPFYLESVKAIGAKVTITTDKSSSELNEVYDYYLVAPSSVTDQLLDQVEMFLQHRLRDGGSACFTVMSDSLSSCLVGLDSLFRTKFLSLSFVCFHGIIEHPQTRPLLRYVGEQVLQLYRAGAFHFRCTETDSFIQECPFEDLPQTLISFLTGKRENAATVLNIFTPQDAYRSDSGPGATFEGEGEMLDTA